MPDNAMSNPATMVTVLAGVAVSLLVISIWAGGILVWSARYRARKKKILDRLDLDAEPSGETRVLRLWRQGQEASVTVPTSASRRSIAHRLDQFCRRAAWQNGPGALIALVAGAFVLSIVAGTVITGSLILGLGAGLAVVVAIRIYFAGRILGREALFERQLVDAMELAARSLRAGHPLLGAFQLISAEMASPISDVFAELCQRHEMGATVTEAIERTADESTSDDLKMFATSVAIQMRVGGNLADLMDRLAAVVRDRARLNRRVRVLTAQTQMSKRVLLALPFLTFVLLNLINPDYMSPLYTSTAGQMMLAAGIVGLTVGAVLMNRMASLQY